MLRCRPCGPCLVNQLIPDEMNDKALGRCWSTGIAGAMSHKTNTCRRICDAWWTLNQSMRDQWLIMMVCTYYHFHLLFFRCSYPLMQARWPDYFPFPHTDDQVHDPIPQNPEEVEDRGKLISQQYEPTDTRCCSCGMTLFPDEVYGLEAWGYLEVAYLFRTAKEEEKLNKRKTMRQLRFKRKTQHRVNIKNVDADGQVCSHNSGWIWLV